MATILRAELSEKNPYWIEKHRYYELKHFCLQYPIWRKAYNSLDGLSSRSSDLAMLVAANTMSDPTAKCAIARTFYADRMNLLKKAAEETDPVLSSYILNAVIEGWSYDILKARLDIPCCKDTYYDVYRRFFWILSKERG